MEGDEHSPESSETNNRKPPELPVVLPYDQTCGER
jgi:hypothetical protein